MDIGGTGRSMNEEMESNVSGTSQLLPLLGI